MTEKKRMHPITIVVSIVKSIKDGIIPLIFGLIFIMEKIGLPFFILAILALFIIIVIQNIIRWYRFTYRVEENEVRIEYGLFVKKKRYIPIERIQTINLTAGVFQRLVGVVKVEIETLGSSSDSSEGELTAIPKEDAETLRLLVKQEKQKNKKIEEIAEGQEGQEEQGELEETPKQVYKLSTKDLVVAAMTSGRVAFIAAVIGGFISQVQDKIPERYVEKFYDGVYEQVAQLSVVLIIGLVLFVLFLTWVISIIGTMIRFGGFTVIRTKEDLHISRGLLEKVEVHVPISRIQGVSVSESLLRQPFGLATVQLHLVSAAADDEGSSERALLPIVKKRNVQAFLRDFLPEYYAEYELERVPKRALPRSLFRHLFYQAIVLGLIAYFVPYGGYGLLLLLPLAIQGYLAYRDRGYVIDGKYCVVQRRSFAHRELSIVELRKIHRVEMQQTYFQKRKQLATYSIYTPEHSFDVVDMEEIEALKIEDWFIHSYRKRVRKV